MKAVVFDIGGVLVDWDPALAWADALGRNGAEAFMARVDFPRLNLRADGGARFAELADEIEDAGDRALLMDYVPNYARTVETRIEGTWDLLDRLAGQGVQVHAITNWSAETWPEGLKAQPRLGEVFGVTIVSGAEGIIKPDPRIYTLFCKRAGLSPTECLFIDDKPANAASAREVGMDALRFTTPDGLEADLMERGLL